MSESEGRPNWPDPFHCNHWRRNIWSRLDALPQANAWVTTDDKGLRSRAAELKRPEKHKYRPVATCIWRNAAGTAELWLGSMHAADKAEWCRNHAITHKICCAGTVSDRVFDIRVCLCVSCFSLRVSFEFERYGHGCGPNRKVSQCPRNHRDCVDAHLRMHVRMYAPKPPICLYACVQECA